MKIIRIATAFAIAVAVAAISSLAIYWLTASQPHFQDVAYAKESSRNTLDVHLSETAAEPQPVVILVHGGGFRSGDKARPSHLDDFLAAGIAVAAINYRLSGEATWPAQLTDVTHAVRFLHDNATDFGIDPDRIAIFGQSAGGHLTATSTFDLAAQGANIIRAVVVWFGPVDFNTMDDDMAASGQGSSDTDGPGSPESGLIGAPVGENPELARSASPLTFLEALPEDARLPPILIMHGAKDPLIAARQSERLHDATAASPSNGGVRLEILAEGTHGGGEFNEPATIQAVIAFLDDKLGLEL
ncbi:alpha/beta hydrolase [Cognatiyoonia sp. IB215446]|uniref:alpha/beta hydrolase n=1 Tax=Cognatiyoonia sp. IB215446 TaxID=3097355 RepID=UPI002A106054|nr:alpha/beta hydrolase [Cognatiyoonia sp. IB215446]MDX8350261.1 alpha/beta hydrolase [Cognatiyoonia sp. IB215446]